MGSVKVVLVVRLGSLFSGIGGIDLAWERAGGTVAFQCEIDDKARSVLDRHWPTVTCHTDVKELTGATLPPVDVLAGGFPCQDLSVAGRRAGLAGERSGLFHQFMRLVDECAPRWVLVENVPGLLSSNGGRDMGVVVGTLADLGYGWCYRVLDAQYFGVAQRRRRVFVVGCAGDAARAAQVLLEPESCGGNPPPRRTTRESVAGTLGDGSGDSGRLPDIARCLTGSNERIDGDTETFLPVGFAWQAGGDRTSSGAFVEDASPTLRVTQTIAVGFHVTQDPISEPDFTPAMGTGNQKGCATLGVAYNPYRTLEKDGSITSGYAARPVVDALHGPTGNKEPLVEAGMAVRRLTPLECERLQGFPDHWTAGQPDSARYRQLGNAVAVPVAQWIARRIHDIDRTGLCRWCDGEGCVVCASRPTADTGTGGGLL